MVSFPFLFSSLHLVMITTHALEWENNGLFYIFSTRDGYNSDPLPLLLLFLIRITTMGQFMKNWDGFLCFFCLFLSSLINFFFTCALCFFVFPS